jgi:hypothetical protein
VIDYFVLVGVLGADCIPFWLYVWNEALLLLLGSMCVVSFTFESNEVIIVICMVIVR